MKKVFSFVKKNLISCICLFLALSVMLTASVTFSKYVSTGTSDKQSFAGSFHCSGSVDGVSSLSFANLDYWGGAEDNMPMNIIHSLNFVVNNYDVLTDEGGNDYKAISAVKMRHSLIFSAPAIFANNLALQLFEGESSPLTPQMVFADLMATADGGVYNTASSENYDGTAYNEFSFTVDSYTVSVGGESVKGCTAVAPLPDGSGNISIKVEPFSRHITQTVKFRLWDVSGITSELYPTVEVDGGGELIAPLYADISGDVICYRVTVSMPEFILSAGVEEQNKYSIKFVTTSVVNDYQLGGYLTENEAGDQLKNLYSGKTMYMKTLSETITDTDSEGKTIAYDSYYVFGNPKVYIDGVEHIGPTSSYEFGGSYSASEVSNGTTDGNIYFDADGNIVDESSAVFYVTVSGAAYNEEKTTTRVVDDSCCMTVSEEETITTTVTTLGNAETITRNFVVTENYYIPAEYLDSQTLSTVTTYNDYKASVIKAYSGCAGNWTETVLTSLPEKLTSTVIASETPTEYSETVTTEYSRAIERVTSFSDSVSFDKVYRLDDDGLGNVIETVFDSAVNAFELFNASNIQKYFVSQCYSKSYPFKLNVIFEQIQN